MTDLNSILDSAWHLMFESAELRGAGFRIAQLATIGTTGAPRLRTVVVRGVSQPQRTVRIHTDIRSSKVAEIEAQSAVSLVSYNRNDGQQIRLEGHAVAHHQNDTAREAWLGSRPQSRVCYRTAFAPGAALSQPGDADATVTMRGPADDDIGFEQFCAVLITVRRLDWLDLAASGHRRAAFDWTGDAWRGGWIAP